MHAALLLPGILLPTWLFVGVLVIAIALACSLVYGSRLYKEMQRDLDLERSKSSRLRHQLSASSSHPDQDKKAPASQREEEPEETPVLQRSSEELTQKYEQLRQTYNKLYARHKTLVTEYKRLHDFLQTKKGAAATSNGDGVQAAPGDSPTQQAAVPEVTVSSSKQA